MRSGFDGLASSASRGLLGGVEVVGGDGVGVVARVAPHGEDGAGARVGHHDRALPVAERLLGQGLDVVAQRELHVAGVHLVVEQVGEAAQLLLRRLAGEHVVVLPLHAVGAVDEREVPADTGEQVAGRVLALQLVAVVRGHAAGHDDAVGGEDGAARPGEVADDLAVVAGVRVVVVRLHDLQPVQLGEQDHVADDEADAEAAELLVHRVTSITVVASDRSARRRSRREGLRGGTSPSRTAVESEMRMRMARRM